MPDNPGPTGAKSVMVSSAEDHSFWGCGAVRPGFDADKMIRAASFTGKDQYAM